MRVSQHVVCIALLAAVVFPTLFSGAAVEATEPTKVIDIMVSPSSIALDSKGVWVTIHADIAYRVVNSITVTLNGIPVTYTKSDLRGDLVAKFDLDEVKAIVEPGSAVLALRGRTVDGIDFVGSEEVRVTARD